MEKMCLNCRYFGCPATEKPMGTCRAKPPTVIFVRNVVGNGGPLTYWPQVLRSDWCGLFESAGKKPK